MSGDPGEYAQAIANDRRHADGGAEAQLHQVADWIADYRENIGRLPVAPNEKPGAILARLPEQPPEEAAAFDQIMADVDRLIIPGMAHWDHPMFLGYFGWTTTGPGILGEIVAAPLSVMP